MNRNQFFTWTALISKHILKLPIIAVLLLLIPVITFIINLLPPSASSSGVTVGLYFEEKNDELTKLMRERLLAESSGSFTFTEYDDEALMLRDAETEKLECAYVFDADFSDSLSSGRYKNSVEVYHSPSSMLVSAVNEIVFANIVRLSGYEVLDEYVRIDGIDDKTQTELRDYMYSAYEAYCTSGETFHLDIVTTGNISINDNAGESLMVTFPLRGLLSILIFLAAITGCTAWLKDNESGLFAPRPRSFHALSRILYPLLPAVLFTVCCELALFISNSSYSPIAELTISLRYILLVTVFANICYFLKKSSLVISLIPVLLLGSLIFCPVFINIENFYPAFRIISRLFIPRYFL